ncbi:hypothetical protein [Tortoise microvirus 79]|nr:hypothetical protein [Tortoise microvirus 79]
MADNKTNVAEAPKVSDGGAADVRERDAGAEARMPLSDPKSFQRVRLDHQLHVNLIMFTYSLPKSKAEIIAYHEGSAGLKVRLQK